MLRHPIACTLYCLLSICSNAQHCPWDGTSLVMLNIERQSAIEIHKIYLTDSTGTVVLRKIYYSDTVVSDTAEFLKNPVPGTGSDYYRNYHFPFANDNYVVEFSFGSNPSPYHIRISYSAGGKNFWKEYVVPESDIHLLCRTNKNLWDGKIKPMTLLLQ